ncbi:hypothetical protein ACFSM5_11270 [Lacibacterium aquatile]|uniref:DUF805 domain-containing protein n=1 Tax=Lacibacterium aquatile TaxID=1168082 RepID=A0ABW5DW42_9PROT
MATIYKIDGTIESHGPGRTGDDGSNYTFVSINGLSRSHHLKQTFVASEVEAVFRPGAAGTFFIAKAGGRHFIYAAIIDGREHDGRDTAREGILKGRLFFHIPLAFGVFMFLWGITSGYGQGIVIGGGLGLFFGIPGLFISLLFERRIPSFPTGSLGDLTAQARPLP